MQRFRLWALRAVRRDTRAKLAALVVATIAFNVVRTTISEQESFRIEVTATLPQEGRFTVVKIDPGDVRVTLRGSRDQLRAIQREDLQARLTLRQAPPGGGYELVTLRSTHIEGRGYARVELIEPQQVRIEYDIEGEMALPVARPHLLGRPLIGRAEAIWAETNVVVRGPLQQLRTLHENAVQLQTEPIDVEGRVQSFTRRVRVLPPPDIGVLRVTPPEIEVRVGIKVDTETRLYENIPVLLTAVTGSGLVLTSEPSTVNVRVTGMAERLDALRPDDISVVADCRNIEVLDVAEGSYPLRVLFPAGVEGLVPEALPKTVTVRARRVVAPVPKPEPSVRTEELPPPAADAATP